VADQPVLQQIGRLQRRASAGQVVAVRGGDDRQLGELACHQRTLRRPRHADGDVGLAPQQVADLVGRHQLHLDRRFPLLQTGQHAGQQPGRRHLAGG
jgi:hypothetical protein